LCHVSAVDFWAVRRSPTLQPFAYAPLHPPSGSTSFLSLALWLLDPHLHLGLLTTWILGVYLHCHHASDHPHCGM
ncbi:hypothetical protein M9458_046960, partial [Cirrhinus mrigala]